MYPGLAVERRGGYTHCLSWAVPEFANEDHERTWVIGQVTAAIDATVASAGVAAPIVIGRSLASLSATVVADRGLAAIWLTPVLTDEPTVSALQAVKGPCMLVGEQLTSCGTAGLPACLHRMYLRLRTPITACSSPGRYRPPLRFSAR